jgi:hypothetical protein
MNEFRYGPLEVRWVEWLAFVAVAVCWLLAAMLDDSSVSVHRLEGLVCVVVDGGSAIDCVEVRVSAPKSGSAVPLGKGSVSDGVLSGGAL